MLFDRALYVVFGLTVLNTTLVSVRWFGQTVAVTGGVGVAAIAAAVTALTGAAFILLVSGTVKPLVVYRWWARCKDDACRTFMGLMSPGSRAPGDIVH